MPKLSKLIKMMSASTSDPKAVQVAELKAFISKERDGRQVKKALAVKLLYQGDGYESTTPILDVSLGALSNWKQAYEAEGLEGFRRRHKGRKSYLSSNPREEVLQWLQQKDIWPIGELEHHLSSVYDVVYESKQSDYDLFAEAGMSWQKTSQVKPKADPEQVTAKKPKSKSVGGLPAGDRTGTIESVVCRQMSFNGRGYRRVGLGSSGGTS